MKLADIYSKKIDRRINPAVVAQDRKEETILIEIEEYVFTDEIINNLYKVLKAIKEKEVVNKTGVWINGYYGSGKSHFLKFIHYCIAPETREKAFTRLVDAVKDRDRNKHRESRIKMDITEILDLKRWYDKAEIEDVLFNAQDVSKSNRDNNTFTHIFFNMFNQCRGYNAYNIPLAILFEKYLDQKNVFEEFKVKLEEEESFDWDTDAADIVSNELDTALRIAKRCIPSLDTDALKTTLLNPETYHIDTMKFSSEVQKHVNSKGENYRLLFLVDEVSQFVNSNREVLLDLQSVVERLSDDCNHQVWVACTAQQTIENVTEGSGINNSNDDYGKIMGRFETRVSLESTDPAYITQKRILDKNSEGTELLRKLYSEKKDAILNQFTMGHELYKGFRTENDFLLSYPFVPYQFKLISQVFDSFQKMEYVLAEVKDNERSVLKITHETAILNQFLEVGQFIPFDAFFNQMFWQNLIHKGTKAISPALELKDVKDNEFAQRVVKVLFMISNLLEKDKRNFNSTPDNLTLLLMKNVDENKLQLRSKIEDVLRILIENNIIREEKGNYYFFNEDEAELSTLIKNTLPGLEFRADTFSKVLFSYFKVENKVRFCGNDFKITASVDGKNYFGNNGDIQVAFSVSDTTPAKNRCFSNPANSLVFSINEWFMADKELSTNFNWYCKVEKYFQDNHEALTEARSKSRENFRNRNVELLKDKINPTLQRRFEETNFISGQTIIESNEINGKSAERYRNILNRHLENVYKYAHLADGLPITAEELRQKANRAIQPDEFGPLHPMTDAEKKVNDHITSIGNEMILSDLISKFNAAPYGWKDISIIYLVTELCKRKIRDLSYKNQPRYSIKDFVLKALTTSERSSLAITSAQEISQETINLAIQSWLQIFNDHIPSTGDGSALFDDFRDNRIQKQLNIWNQVKDICENYPFIKPIHQLIEKLTKWQAIRDPKRLFEVLQLESDSMAMMVDKCRQLQEFEEDFLEDYKSLRKFCTSNQVNFNYLTESDQIKASKLITFIDSEWPVDDFRTQKIIHKELSQAINDKIETLLKEVTEKYNVVFEELTTLAKENEVALDIQAKQLSKTETINKLSSIVALQLALSEVEVYLSAERSKILIAAEEQRLEKERQEQLKLKPYDKPIPTSTAAEPPFKYALPKANKILSTKSDVETYVEQIRVSLFRLIDENKKIIIK
ncbi:MAG TPA: BREX system P-loop protein BrxC [Paludibacter sp.]